jgi:hypothetical protein
VLLLPLKNKKKFTKIKINIRKMNFVQEKEAAHLTRKELNTMKEGEGELKLLLLLLLIIEFQFFN